MRRNLVTSLFRHGRIVTTMPKAKAARRDAERLITMAKVESVHNLRKAFAYLQNDEIVHKLFEISVQYVDRNGGYTAIHRLAKNRLGDNASQVVWQLVTWEPGTKPKPRKRKKAKDRPAQSTVKTEPKETSAETPAADAEPKPDSAPTQEEGKD